MLDHSQGQGIHSLFSGPGLSLHSLHTPPWGYLAEHWTPPFNTWKYQEQLTTIPTWDIVLRVNTPQHYKGSYEQSQILCLGEPQPRPPQAEPARQGSGGRRQGTGMTTSGAQYEPAT